MSNFSRKLRKQKNRNGVSKNNSVMEDIYEFYFLSLDFDEDGYRVEVISYNKNFYGNGEHFVNSYGLIFSDFVEYNNRLQKRGEFLNFLYDSVENNHYLCDSIEEIDFTIKNDHIYFKRYGDNLDYINMGEFYIDNCKVNVCHSYAFIEDLRNGKKYLYYGD